MFLDEEFHAVSNVLEESGKNRLAHPRTVVHAVNGRKVLVAIPEVLVQPFVYGADGFAQAKGEHVPPFSSRDAVFTHPQGAECSGGTVAVLHASNGFALNPKNGELRKEEHQEDDVHEGKRCNGERKAACALFERCAFEDVDDARAKKPVFAQEEAYQIIPVIHGLTSTIGLPNARVKAAHDGWYVRHLVPDHRLGNVRDGDEHR